MVIDVHCHVGLSSKRVDQSIPRFSFEVDGARGTPGYDSYLSPRLLKRAAWWFVRRWMGIDLRLRPGDKLDAVITEIANRHWFDAPGVDQLVLLAFDEYYDDAGRVIGRAEVGQKRGSDIYVSNSFVRSLCAARPERFLFGGSIHPYRWQDGKTGADMLEELAVAGVALIKWLPIHQNIRAEDPRTVEFLRKAAELRIPMLIHYGGEMSLSRQHMEFEHPGPMLEVLRQLRRENAMPTVIVAHAATPSFIWQSRGGHDALIAALLGEFKDAPLYADISALAAFGRTPWLRRLAKMPQVHRKLVFGTDYPIPVLKWPFRHLLSREDWGKIRAASSWVEQDVLLKRALGFHDCVFTQAAEILNFKKTVV